MDFEAVRRFLGSCALLLSLAVYLPETVIAAPTPLNPLIRMMHQFTPTKGWILAGNQLLWTDTNGAEWNNITPPLSSEQALDTAYFLDTEHGWSVLHSPTPEGNVDITIAMTNNGGQSWTTVPFSSNDPELSSGYAAGGRFSFRDPLHGQMLLNEVSGAAYSRGFLFETIDGGTTWTELPIPPVKGEIQLGPGSREWLLGGSRDAKLYTSVDGGREWKLLSLGPPAPKKRSPNVSFSDPSYEETYYSLPTFSDEQKGMLTVNHTLGTDLSTLTTYATTDGGQSWKLQATTDLPISYKAPTAITNAKVITAFHKEDSKLSVRSDSTLQAPAAPAGLPSELAVISLDFSDALHGWMLAISDKCVTYKSNCTRQTVLLGTADGGGSLSVLYKGFQFEAGPEPGQRHPMLHQPKADLTPTPNHDSLATFPEYVFGWPNGNTPSFTTELDNFLAMDSCNTITTNDIQRAASRRLFKR